MSRPWDWYNKDSQIYDEEDGSYTGDSEKETEDDYEKYGY